ncbi:MAG: hypothetical protein CMJ40_02185 [Phycisphaerae bacterium]|nr:hypothetical protein [Phycisphaerae bacterium]|tara:strand:- start:1804 stop:2649 length:846 start_codon:yes stop_codon:yes gene_type:complete
MGTRVNLIFYAEGDKAANQAAEAAFDRINAIEQSISDWLIDSEVARLRSLPRGESAALSEDLNHILALSVDISNDSEGAFDVTCGALTQAWRKARHIGQMPSSDELAALASTAGWERLARSEVNGVHRVSIDQDGLWLDFGGIGKGYAADQALDVLESRGITSALVELGGDMAIGVPPPGQVGWIVDGGSKEGPLVVSKCGVATSGSTDQFLEIDGRRWSHLLDPRTGQAVPDRGSFTVTARNASLADGWASVAAIVGVEVAGRMVGTEEQVEFRVTANPR